MTSEQLNIVDGIVAIIEMALPDEAELLRLIERSPDKSHAGLAKFIAEQIRNRVQENEGG